jgi:hypothetical protein
VLECEAGYATNETGSLATAVPAGQVQALLSA